MACITLLFSVNLFSQANGDYQSNGAGKWSAAGTWQKYNGTVWANATTAPTGSENITIQATDSVDINIPVTITGYVKSLGGKLGKTTTDTNLTFGNGSTFEAAYNAGSMPVAKWGTGSTCTMTGVTSTVPSSNNQNYYNFYWNCPNYGSSALNLGWGGNTIGGNLRVKGCPNRTYLRLTSSNIGNTAPGANVITINGDIIMEDWYSALTSTGSSGTDTIEVWVKGNITSSGLFNLANGSGAMCKWYLAGNLTILDSITTNSNVTTLPDSLIFNGTTKQTFYKADTVGSAANIQFALRPGAIVDLSTTAIGGTATTFTMPSGTTLITSNPRGLSGNLNMQGSIKLPVDGNFEYDGAVTQKDSILPITVNNLTINNSDTVSFTKSITVNGILKLQKGLLDNSINSIVIGTGGSVVFAGGNVAVPISGWPNSVKDVKVAPKVFKLFNNYPNPFNPSTTIRFSVPKDGFTSLKVYNILGQQIASLFEGVAKAGNELEVVFDAKNIPSGIYFARLQQDEKNSIQKMILLK
jgi:hypothetical protein